MKKSIIFIFILLMLFAAASGETRRSLVKKGNKSYSKDDWGNAIAKYEAAGQKGSLPAIDYNLGDALYKSGSYDKAAENFLKALNGSDNPTKAKTLHNLGNTFLKNGKMQEAVTAYKNSLKLNPGDVQTKQNLEYALRQMQNQQKQNQDNKDQQNQDKDKQKQNQQKQQQDKQKQQDQQQQQQQQQNQQDKKDQMSEQNAKALLDAMKNDEKETQQKVMRLKMAGRRPKAKNW